MRPEARRSLLALLCIVPAPTIGVSAAMIWWPGTATGKAIFLGCKAWMLLVPLAWRLLVDRQPLSLSPARKGGFAMGAAIGLAISGIIWAAYYGFAIDWIDVEQVRGEAIDNGIGTKGAFLGMAAFWILANSVMEEYVYRWFIFRKCEHLMATRVAVFASAAFFTVHHVIALRAQLGWDVTLLASLGVFIGGAVWSWMYGRYRSVWPGYLSHAIVDVAIYIVGWGIIFGPAT